MADTSVVITFGNAILPKYAKLQEKVTPTVAKQRTPSGKLFVDYMSNARAWQISWNWLLKSEYELIRAEYMRQFSTASLLAFSVSGNISVPTVLAYMELPDPRNIKFAGQWVQDFTITIEEQNAISN